MAIKKFNSVEGFSVGEPGSIIDVVDNVANVYANRVFVEQYANLGSIANIYIGGGSSGYVLKTDGAGNLSWGIDTAAAGGSANSVQFNTGGSLDGSSAFQFNKTSNVLSITGNITTNNANLGNLATANYLTGTLTTQAQPNVTSVGVLNSVSVTGTANLINASNVSLGPVGNIHIDGGTSGYVLQTDGAGNLAWWNPDPVTVTYVPNSFTQTNGVYVTGDLYSIQVFGDYTEPGGVYTLTDGSGTAPAWTFEVDFIDVVEFNRVVLNINYTANSGHTVYVQLYNNSTSDWDNIGTYTGLGSYYAFALQVIDDTNYINGSDIVRLRLYHSNGGNTSHTTNIDYMAIEQSTQGPQGPRGPTGPTGATGATGPGVASGGTAGQVLIKNSSANYDTSWTNDLTSLGNVTLTGNISSGNANLGNLATASYFSGNGSLLTHITGANVTGQVGNALVAGTVYTNAQPNITSVGTLSTLTVTGLVTATAGGIKVGNLQDTTGTNTIQLTNSNVIVTGNITAGASGTGNVTATYFIGNGSQLTGIVAGNVTGQVANALVAGTVYTAAQPNITSVGTLTTVNVTGNVTSGNATLGNLVTANYFSGDGSFLTNVPSGTKIANGTSNVNIPSTNGNVTVSVNGTQNVVVVGNTLVTINGNLAVTGSLSKDSKNVTTYVSSTTTPTSPTVGDQWYNQTNDITYQYIYDGVTSYWVDISSGYIGSNVNAVANTLVLRDANANIYANNISGSGLSVTGVSNLGDIGNVKITGGTNGYVLQTDGTGNLSFISAGSTGIAGANTQIQFNDAGSFGADANFTYNKATDTLGVKFVQVESTGNIIGGNLVSANYITGTLTTQAQPNITSVGTLSSLTVGGNATIAGNLTVSGNTTFTNANNLYIKDPIIEMGGGANGDPLTTNDGKDRGSLLHYYTTTPVDAFMGWDNSNGEFAFGSNVSVSSEVVTFNTFGNLRAAYYIGNGSALTSITGGNVTGQVANALVAGTVYTAAQPNITSTGTLASVNVTGNVSSGGNIIGNGQYLTSITGANITGQVANALVAGTVYTAAQPNITSVGTITTLNVSGNANVGGTLYANTIAGSSSNVTVTAGAYVSTFDEFGNITLSNNVTVSANLTVNQRVNFSSTSNVTLGAVGNIHISGGGSGYVLSTDGAGALSWVSPGSTGIAGANTQVQFNDGGAFGASAGFTFNKTTSTLSVTGNISSGNANLGNLATANYFSGNGSLLTSITGGNVTGQVANALVSGTVYSNAQPNITSVGTLSSLSVTANASAGNILTDHLLYANGVAWSFGSTYSNANVESYLPTYTGNVSAAYFIGNGSALSSITGGNVVGQVGNALVAGTVYTAAQPNITSTGTLTSVNVTGNVSSGGNIIGNGQYLTSINGSNVTGQVANALVAGTVYTAAQPNITSVGTLSSLSVTANASAGNILTDHLLYANGVAWSFGSTYSNANVESYLPTYTGNVSAAYFIGNGSALSSITGSNVVGQVGNALVAGTVYTAAQPNITSVGTLSSLSVTANASAGNILTDNLLYANGVAWSFGSTYSNANVSAYLPTYTGNVSAAYFIGNGSALTSLAGSNVVGQVGNALVAGTVYSNAQPNITSVGTLTSVDVSGNVSSGGNLIGNGQYLTSINGSNVTGQVANALVAGTVYTAAQPNITSVGTLTSVSVTGNVSSGNANLGNLVTANYFTGNGSLLTSITGANVTGTVANATYATSAGSATTAGTVTTNAQPNITSVGSLSGLTVSNVTGVVDFVTTANVSLGAIANIHISGGTSGYVLQTDGTGGLSWVAQAGSGFNISGITQANPGVVTVTSAYNFLNGDPIVLYAVGGMTQVNNQPYYAKTTGYTSTTFALYSDALLTTPVNTSGFSAYTSGGQVSGRATVAVAGSNTQVQFNDSGVFGATTALTFNKTSNTLTTTNVNVTANLTVGNVDGANLISANYFSGSGNLLSNIQAGNITGTVANANYSLYAGTVLTNAQPNITSVGTLSSVNVTGNVSSGGNIVGNGQYLTSITGANVTGQVGNALVAGTVYTAAQPNITSVGTLSSVTVTGNVSSGGNLIGNGQYLTSITGANVTGQVGNALVAGTVYSNAQPNITSVGTLTSLVVSTTANVGTLNATDAAVSGNVIITGNLVVGGTTDYINVTNLYVKDPIIEMGGGANGAALTTNDGKDRGTLLHYYTTGTVDAFMGWDNSNGEFGFGSNVSVTGEVVTWNNYGNIRAGYFIGNGSLLTSITAGNVTGQVANALVAGTVYTNAQPNITSVGTLSSLSVTANVTAGNIDGGNLVAANYVSGNGSLLTSLTGANVTGTVANANYAAYAGNVVTAAQPNITSVGSLSGLIVSNATGVVDFTTTANVTLGSVSNLHISGGSSGYVLSTNGSGSLSWVAQSGGGGTPGGTDTQVQFNDGGSTFGGNAGFTYNKTTTTLTANNFVATSTANLGSVGNVTITGGSPDYVLKTDGAGNLSWTAQTGGGGDPIAITADTFTGNGVQTEFTLSVTPSDIKHTVVNYNGATLLRDAYSLSGANIIFDNAPANGSYIEVTITELQDSSSFATTGKAIAMAIVFGF